MNTSQTCTPHPHPHPIALNKSRERVEVHVFEPHWQPVQHKFWIIYYLYYIAGIEYLQFTKMESAVEFESESERLFLRKINNFNNFAKGRSKVAKRS